MGFPTVGEATISLLGCTSAQGGGDCGGAKPQPEKFSVRLEMAYSRNCLSVRLSHLGNSMNVSSSRSKIQSWHSHMKIVIHKRPNILVSKFVIIIELCHCGEKLRLSEFT